jgi:uncharacterized protein (DUF1778 family)
VGSKRRSAPKTVSKPRKDTALVKSAYVRIRVSKADKDLLEQAATRVGLGVSAFMLSASMEKARTALGT